MKPKNPSPYARLRHRFPPFPLYRSDIEEIIHIAEGRELVVKLSDENYEFDSLDDLKVNRGKRIKRLILNFVPSDSTYEYIAIDVDADGITLVATRNDRLISVWHEIKDAIGSKQPWYANYLKPFPWGLGGMLLLIFFPKREQLNNGAEWVLQLWAGLMLLCFFMNALSLLYLYKSKGVYLQRAHEVEGVWDRYGEKVIMLIIGTLLGVAGKVIADKF
ncbi:MAG TPA: hypothetical protein DCK83_02510 [Gallionellaceae bacterium]|nr:hypothetical protein [Gallionellaceae bacterium]